MALVMAFLSLFADDDLAVLARSEAIALLPSSASASHGAAAVAAQFFSTLTNNSQWPDIAYDSSDQRVEWPAAKHVARARAMALAAADDHGPQFGNATLLKGAERALLAWVTLNLENANWWQNQIGVPKTMAEALLLMMHAPRYTLPNSVLAACNSCQSCLQQAHAGAMTGANLVWLTHIAMQNALLHDNSTAVGQCFDYIYSEVKRSPQDGDGVMADGSFHQHGPQLLLGSYGSDFVRDITTIAARAAPTRWALPTERLAALAALILDGDAWATDAEGSAFDWQVVGRDVARKGANGAVSYDTAALRALGGPRAAEMEAFARRLEARGNASAAAAAPALHGFRGFFDSDYAVMRGKRDDGTHNAVSWAITVHMRSVRTIGAACVNGEGRPTEHASDGVTAIYTAGDAGYWGAPDPAHGAFPALDWQRLPGLTAEVAPELLRLCDNDVQKTPPWKTSFVGSCTGCGMGVAAMDLWSHNLTAARAWFLSDDGLLSLGARVAVNSSNPAITTIDVRRFAGTGAGSRVVTSTSGAQGLNVSSEPHLWHGRGGRGEAWWLWYDCVGYIVVDEEQPPAGDGAAGVVNVTLAQRFADWHTMSTALSGNFTLPLLQIELSSVVGGAFAYRVIPGVSSPAEMPALATRAGRGWLVLSNTPQIQLVAKRSGAPGGTGRQQGAFTMQAVFWEAGTTAGGDQWPVLSASAPCLLVVSSSGSVAGAVDIAVSSPNNSGGAHVRVGIAGAGIADGLDCRVDNSTGSSSSNGGSAGGVGIDVLLPVGDSMGSTTSFHCVPPRPMS